MSEMRLKQNTELSDIAWFSFFQEKLIFHLLWNIHVQRPIRFSIVIICKISQNMCWIVLLVTVSGLRVQLVGATTVPLKIESTSIHESFITGLLFTELRLLLRAKSVRSAYYSALVQGKPNKTLKLWLSLQTFRHGVQLYFRNNIQLQLTNCEEKKLT